MEIAAIVFIAVLICCAAGGRGGGTKLTGDPDTEY